MAVWLSMDMSYVGPGDYANTSKVAVNVYVHWDTPSYNGLSPALNVTVDGVSDTVNVSFNTGQTSSGSQNIYSRYWNVEHDSNGSARTVYASASYATGTGSGTVGASTSLSLDAIGGSGGGDSGGGDPGDDSGETTYYTSTYNFIVGDHTKIEVYFSGVTLLDTITASQTKTYTSSWGASYLFVMIADDGYVLSGCSVDGKDCDGEATILNYSGDEHTIIVSAIAVVPSGIYIDDGTNNSLYGCYIDNGPEMISKNCEIVGHRSFYTYPDFLDYVYSNGSGTYNMNNKEYIGAYYDSSYDEPVNYAYVLAFKAPEYIHGLVNFIINIELNERISGYIKDNNQTMNYALCSSDLNYSMYTKTVGQLGDKGLEDEFEITHGTFSLEDTNNIVINEMSLNKQNDMYYLFIWDDQRVGFYSDECPINVHSASRHTITYTYIGNQFTKYIPYIDNGTSWEIIS